MKVLLVGGGGREHALVWKIAQSPLIDTVFAAPGNPGIARHASCVDISVDSHDELVAFTRREGIDLTVVGPEVPLVAGLADRLAAAGLSVLGPSARAAAIEGSKVFAKNLMLRHGIPTAQFSTFDEPAHARRYCRDVGAPLVVKADGLAAGKGAIVCRTLEEADAAIAECMERRAFGTSGARVVVEELMVRQDVSFFLLANGHDAMRLRAAEDHKAVRDASRGEAWPPAHRWPHVASVCVWVASGGYPGKCATGLPIRGVEAAEARPDVQVFHAGTATREGRLVTAGGRVLGVTAVAENLTNAMASAYSAVREIFFDGMHYRTDIGRRGVRAEAPPQR